MLKQSLKVQIRAADQYFFKMSECLHLLGMRCGGKFSTPLIAPKQSEIIVTNPLNDGAI